MTMQGQCDIVDEHLKNFFCSEKVSTFAFVVSKIEFVKFFATVSANNADCKRISKY